VAFDLEVQLVAFDLSQPAGRDDRAARLRRREMPDVDLITDCGLVFCNQALDGLVAGPLHEADHGRSRKDALSPNVLGDQCALDHAFNAPFEAWPYRVGGRQHLDCLR